MSIPALPSSTVGNAFGIPAPAKSARPAGEARAVAAADQSVTPTSSGEVGNRLALQVEQARPVEATAKTDKAEQEAKPKELEEAVKKLNEQLKPVNPSVRFNVDDDSDRLVIQLMDIANDTVIRQIPSEEALKLSREPDLKRSGLVLNTKA